MSDRLLGVFGEPPSVEVLAEILRELVVDAELSYAKPGSLEPADWLVVDSRIYHPTPEQSRAIAWLLAQRPD